MGGGAKHDPPSQGHTRDGVIAVCIASGPSLTKEDAEATRGLTTVVANRSFELAPWADYLIAMDAKFWQVYADKLNDFRGRRISAGRLVTGTEQMKGFRFRNSGANAIGFAIGLGAKRVLLLGYDCKAGARKHWHEDHPAPLHNCGGLITGRWLRDFDEVAGYAKCRGVEVVNCSRDTALRCFMRATLAEAL